jgi:excisionase family DNA binding protein
MTDTHADAVNQDILLKWAYNVAEVAKILGISKAAVRRLIKSGRLRARNTGAAYIIPKSAVQEVLAGADEPLASAS